MNFTSLVVAGGGLTVISVVGAIKYFEEKDCIRHVRNVVGTSAGAIICLFLALNYRYEEILRFFEDNLQDPAITQCNMNDVFSFFTDYGLSKGENIITFAQRILQKKLHKDDITFLELAKLSGKNLVVCVTNLTDEREEFLSVDTTPTMSIITALRMSCSIPFLFTPVKYEEKLYVDGALYSNFPMSYFADHTLGDVLGIRLGGDFAPPTDFISYALHIVFTLVKKINRGGLPVNSRIITLDVESISWFSLMQMKITVSKETIEKYINAGYWRVKEHFAQISANHYNFPGSLRNK